MRIRTPLMRLLAGRRRAQPPRPVAHAGLRVTKLGSSPPLTVAGLAGRLAFAPLTGDRLPQLSKG